MSRSAGSARRRWSGGAGGWTCSGCRNTPSTEGRRAELVARIALEDGHRLSVAECLARAPRCRALRRLPAVSDAVQLELLFDPPPAPAEAAARGHRRITRNGPERAPQERSDGPAPPRANGSAGASLSVDSGRIPSRCPVVGKAVCYLPPLPARRMRPPRGCRHAEKTPPPGAPRCHGNQVTNVCQSSATRSPLAAPALLAREPGPTPPRSLAHGPRLRPAPGRRAGTKWPGRRRAPPNWQASC